MLKGRYLIVATALTLVVLLVGCWGGTPIMVVSGQTEYGNPASEGDLTSGTEIDFGFVMGDGTYTEITFTIANTGTGDLILAEMATDPIAITGDAGGFYSVAQQPESVIPPEATQDFILRFTSDGTSEDTSATAAIASNDPENANFTLSLIGTSS